MTFLSLCQNLLMYGIKLKMSFEGLQIICYAFDLGENHRGLSQTAESTLSLLLMALINKNKNGIRKNRFQVFPCFMLLKISHTLHPVAFRYITSLNI